MKKFILLYTAMAALTFPACKKKAPANNPANNNEQLIVGKWHLAEITIQDANGQKVDVTYKDKNEAVKSINLNERINNNDCPKDLLEIRSDQTYTMFSYNKDEGKTDCTKIEEKGSWEVKNKKFTFADEENKTIFEIARITDNSFEIEDEITYTDNETTRVLKIINRFEKAK